MRWLNTFLLFFLSVSICVSAEPPNPAGYYGSLLIDGSPAPVGTVVEAWINGVHYPPDFVVTTPGIFGIMSVNGDDPATPGSEGGIGGDTVVFKVFAQGSLRTAGTSTWNSGVNQNIGTFDVDASGTPTPQPSPTVVPPSPTIVPPESPTIVPPDSPTVIPPMSPTIVPPESPTLPPPQSPTFLPPTSHSVATVSSPVFSPAATPVPPMTGLHITPETPTPPQSIPATSSSPVPTIPSSIGTISGSPVPSPIASLLPTMTISTVVSSVSSPAALSPTPGPWPKPSIEVFSLGHSLREVNEAFLQVVAGLAVLLIAVHALRYVTSDNPQERADIKKGIIYIIIGVFIAYLAAELVEGIYCFALNEAFGISIGDCRALI
ncbi:MAG: hypothetical protein ABH851_06415 [Methanobacteriota archaeon]